MRGLILKDMINQKGQIITYLFILVLWMAVAYFNKSEAFFIGAIQMLALMIPLLSMAYDERTKWDLFAITMPVTRREIVVSKYAFTLITLFAVAAISLIGALIIRGELEEGLLLAVFSFPLGLTVNSVILPIMFRFGVEKGRFVFLGVVAAFLLAGFIAAKLPAFESMALIVALFSFAVDNVWAVVALCWAASVCIAAASMAISLRVYARKEF